MTLRQFLRTDDYITMKKLVLGKSDFSELIGAIFNTNKVSHDRFILEEIIDVLDRQYHSDYNRFFNYEECFILKSILWAAAPNDQKEDEKDMDWDYSLQRAYWRKLLYKLRNR